jgi:hypothetical protein
MSLCAHLGSGWAGPATAQNEALISWTWARPARSIDTPHYVLSAEIRSLTHALPCLVKPPLRFLSCNKRDMYRQFMVNPIIIFWISAALKRTRMSPLSFPGHFRLGSGRVTVGTSSDWPELTEMETIHLFCIRSHLATEITSKRYRSQEQI